MILSRKLRTLLKLDIRGCQKRTSYLCSGQATIGLDGLAEVTQLCKNYNLGQDLFCQEAGRDLVSLKENCSLCVSCLSGLVWFLNQTSPSAGADLILKLLTSEREICPVFHVHKCTNLNYPIFS